MYQTSHVDDDEDLYRCIWNNDEGQTLYVLGEGGKVNFSASAFADPRNRPSVDRARLCNHDPKWTRKKPSAGVTKIVASKVRGIGPLQRLDGKGRIIGQSTVDIEHVPITGNQNERDNFAHAEIYADPQCSTNAFRRIREALAFIASEYGWVLEPPDAS